jgi:hypothetical protein
MNQRQRKKREKQRKDARTRVLFNTGTVVHVPAKGRGSYRRRKKTEGADESE